MRFFTHDARINLLLIQNIRQYICMVNKLPMTSDFYIKIDIEKCLHSVDFFIYIELQMPFDMFNLVTRRIKRA